MPSPHEVTAFQAIIVRLAEFARADATRLWHLVHNEDDLVAIYPGAMDRHIGASSLVSAHWYDSLSDKPFAVRPAPPPPLHTLEYKARWAANEPDPAVALGDASDRLVFTASRDTITSNADREHVAYARHAQPDACAWCSVLATRGAVYHSAETAMASHDNCHCLPAPNRDGNPYAEPPYVDDWRHEYAIARKETDSKDLNTIVNAMRRERHAQEKTLTPTGVTEK